MNPPSDRTPLAWALLAAIVAAGLWPYRWIVDHYPWKVDDLKWVTESATTNPDWARWVFGTTHFVGYRPVTAGSFTLDHALGGWTPEVYRLTDFALHALAAVGVALVFRALVISVRGRFSSSDAPWMLLAAAVFVAHPAVEEALPYLARRSYLLATAFASFGVWAFLRNLRQDRAVDGNAVAATALLALAILSNEVAYVALPMLPLLALHARWTPGASPADALRRCALPWLPVIPAVVARYAVLGWTGGYVKHYFAFTRAGRKVLREVMSFNGPEIVGASLEYVWFPVSMEGASSAVAASALAVFAIAAFYFHALVVEPLGGLRDRERRTPLLFFVWMIGFGLLYALSRTWFWRQGYPMVVPFALAVAWVAGDTVRRFADRPVALVARLAPQALLLLAVAWHSPVVVGMDRGAIEGRFVGNEILHEVAPLLDAVEGPAVIYTALPLNKANTRNAHAWLDRLYTPRKLQFKAIASGAGVEPLLTVAGDRAVLAPRASVTEAVRRAYRIEDDVVRFSELRGRGSAWLLFAEPDGRWALVRTAGRGEGG